MKKTATTKIIDVLKDGPATAAKVAGILGVGKSSVITRLKTLSDVGIVKEVPVDRATCETCGLKPTGRNEITYVLSGTR